LVIPGAVDVPWEADVEPVPYQTVWENATTSLKAVLPMAEKHGISIGVEIIKRSDPIQTR
jgi:sugar phosphate isomerase/epimerase